MILFPFEQYSNIFQMTVLLFLSCWVWLQAKRSNYETAVRVFSAGLFCFFLGDVFWTAHLLVRGSAVAVFSPSDIAWIGMFVWLFASMVMLCNDSILRPWWVWALAAVVPVNYLIWVVVYEGDPIVNGMWGIVMTLLMWQIGCGIAANNTPLRPFFFSSLTFMLLELVLFLSSGTVYTVIDLLVTISIVVMSVTLVKGVRTNG